MSAISRVIDLIGEGALAQTGCLCENDARRSKYDSMGNDAPGTYRRIVEALANGSLDELKRAFLQVTGCSGT